MSARPPASFKPPALLAWVPLLPPTWPLEIHSCLVVRCSPQSGQRGPLLVISLPHFYLFSDQKIIQAPRSILTVPRSLGASSRPLSPLSYCSAAGSGLLFPKQTNLCQTSGLLLHSSAPCKTLPGSRNAGSLWPFRSQLEYRLLPETPLTTRTPGPHAVCISTETSLCGMTYGYVCLSACLSVHLPVRWKS